MSLTVLRAVSDSVLEARETSSCGPNPCEKPFSNRTFVLPIVLGIAIPTIGASLAFLILWRRRKRKQKEEDSRLGNLDFGLDLDDLPRPAAAGRGGRK